MIWIITTGVLYVLGFIATLHLGHEIMRNHDDDPDSSEKAAIMIMAIFWPITIMMIFGLSTKRDGE